MARIVPTALMELVFCIWIIDMYLYWYIHIYMYETTRIPCTQTYTHQISIYLFKPRKKPNETPRKVNPLTLPPQKDRLSSVSLVFLPCPSFKYSQHWNFCSKGWAPVTSSPVISTGADVDGLFFQRVATGLSSERCVFSVVCAQVHCMKSFQRPENIPVKHYSAFAVVVCDLPGSSCGGKKNHMIQQFQNQLKN